MVASWTELLIIKSTKQCSSNSLSWAPHFLPFYITCNQFYLTAAQELFLKLSSAKTSPPPHRNFSGSPLLIWAFKAFHTLFPIHPKFQLNWTTTISWMPLYTFLSLGYFLCLECPYLTMSIVVVGTIWESLLNATFLRKPEHPTRGDHSLLETPWHSVFPL